MEKRTKFLRCCKIHWVNGSPVYPEEHVHIGVWDTVLHIAFSPQEPGQGSLHFWLMHAKLLGHSLLLIHSGLQLGGEPVNSGKQEHDGELLITWHCAFGPQGDGSQGFCCGGTSNAKIKFNSNAFQDIDWHLTVNNQFFKIFSRFSIHLTNGSPVIVTGQLQIGLWLTTWQIALIPHDPIHGLLHFWFMQASVGPQSVLTTHSGLQVGGIPTKPKIQVHTACSFTSLHWLFGPQGDGLHGLVTRGSDYRKEESINPFVNFLILTFFFNNNLWLLYLWMDYRKQMHCPSFQQDSCTLAHDCTRCKLHFDHKYRYKDQHICYVDKFESKDNLY